MSNRPTEEIFMHADREHRTNDVVDALVALNVRGELASAVERLPLLIRSGYDDLAAGKIRELIEHARSYVRNSLPGEEQAAALARNLLDKLCLLDATYL